MNNDYDNAKLDTSNLATYQALGVRQIKLRLQEEPRRAQPYPNRHARRRAAALAERAA